MEEKKLTLGIGIKVWGILCIVLSVITAVINITLGNVILFILGILVSAAYVWLLTSKKRLAFYLIVLFVIAVMIVNIVVYHTSIVTSLSGILNPVITYALLIKYWKDMD